MSLTAENLVAAVRRRGSNASDPRDAAHEACHAIRWKVTKRWTRDNIHARKPRGNKSLGVHEEILARAVEQIVCADLGYDCGSVEQWAHVCWMEMLKNQRISLPLNGWLEGAIKHRMTTKVARQAADDVLELCEDAVRRPAQGVVPRG